MVDTLVRNLDADDEPSFRAFLGERASSSMFLLSNSRAAGFVDEGKPLQGTYVGAFADGRLVGVAAHFWNGMVLVQAPAELIAPETVGELARRAVDTSGRAVSGFSGPADQVAVARHAFTLPRPVVDEIQGLYALKLHELCMPRALTASSVVCRAPDRDELPLLSEWRRAYQIETLASEDTPELHERCRRDIEGLATRSQLWVLDAEGALVAMTAFNARIPEMVQVGGVYTPPALRGRGHARCAVAGSLLAARADGAARAILFTNNPAAARAYEALGFARIGEYALVLL